MPDSALNRRSEALGGWKANNASFGHQIIPRTLNSIFYRIADDVSSGCSGYVYVLNRLSALMESAALWKVDATEAALRAEPGLDRFP